MASAKILVSLFYSLSPLMHYPHRDQRHPSTAKIRLYGLLTTYPCGFPTQFQQNTNSFCVPQSPPRSEPACLFKSQHTSPWSCTPARLALSPLPGSFLSFLWAFSLAVPSVWNTVPAIYVGAAYSHHSGLSSNVTSSEKPSRDPGHQQIGNDLFCPTVFTQPNLFS